MAKPQEAESTAWKKWFKRISFPEQISQHTLSYSSFQSCLKLLVWSLQNHIAIGIPIKNPDIIVFGLMAENIQNDQCNVLGNLDTWHLGFGLYISLIQIGFICRKNTAVISYLIDVLESRQVYREGWFQTPLKINRASTTPNSNVSDIDKAQQLVDSYLMPRNPW